MRGVSGGEGGAKCVLFQADEKAEGYQVPGKAPVSYRPWIDIHRCCVGGWAVPPRVGHIGRKHIQVNTRNAGLEH